MSASSRLTESKCYFKFYLTNLVSISENYTNFAVGKQVLPEILKKSFLLYLVIENVGTFLKAQEWQAALTLHAWAAIPITSPTGFPTTIYKSVAIQFTLLLLTPNGTEGQNIR